MRTLTKTLMLGLLAVAPGCVQVAADVDADGNVSFDLGDLGTTCVEQVMRAPRAA